MQGALTDLRHAVELIENAPATDHLSNPVNGVMDTLQYGGNASSPVTLSHGPSSAVGLPGGATGRLALNIRYNYAVLLAAAGETRLAEERCNHCIQLANQYGGSNHVLTLIDNSMLWRCSRISINAIMVPPFPVVPLMCFHCVMTTRIYWRRRTGF